MAVDFSIKRNDLAPSLRGTATDGNGAPINLSDITDAVFLMTLADPTATGPTINRQAATIEDAIAGTLRYDWQQGDTATAGIYKGEFELTKSSGQPETIPNDGYLMIEIKPDLG